MIIQLENLAEVRANHVNEKIVLTSGTFDLLHVGHLHYLRTIRTLGDIMIVMMSDDDRVRSRKGPSRPVIPEQDRAEMLDALKIVDYVFIDPATALPDEIDPVHSEIVNLLQPDLYATDGEDPRFWNIMDSSKLKVIERTKDDVSTTDIIRRIQSLENS